MSKDLNLTFWQRALLMTDLEFCHLTTSLRRRARSPTIIHGSPVAVRKLTLAGINGFYLRLPKCVILNFRIEDSWMDEQLQATCDLHISIVRHLGDQSN